MAIASMSELNIKSGYHYGYDAQSNMLMEECAELIQAMNKHKRAMASGNIKDICKATNMLAEEIADVELMIEQIKYLSKIPEEEISYFKLCKVARTKERIESEGKKDD